MAKHLIKGKKMAKVNMKDIKAIKKVGKELQLIVNPTDEDDKKIVIAKGDLEAIKKKIKDCAAVLTTSDQISEELAFVLTKLKITIPEPPEDDDKCPECGEDTDDCTCGDSDYALDDIMKMKIGELKKINKAEKLKIKTTGLKVKELRNEVVEKLGLNESGDTDADAPCTEEELNDMDFDDMEELVEEHADFFGDEIDMDDFDEDEDDDVESLKTKILELITPEDTDDDTDGDSDGEDEMPEVPEVDKDDPDETHETLVDLVEEHDLDDIDPDDFDEDEEDEVNDFRDKVIEALEEKFGDDNDNDNDDPEDEDEPTLVDEVEALESFKDMKKMVKDNEIFAKLNDKKKLKKFKDSPEKLQKKMLKIVNKSAGDNDTTSDKKTNKDETGKSSKKPGVIAFIVECISTKPISKASILKKMVKQFPDREEAKMKKTLNIQVPGRISKEKNSSLTEKDDKWFFKKTENGIKKTK